jgi:cold shock protein
MLNFITRVARRTLSFFKFFTMQKGTVKFFNEAKGFGFIVDSTSGTEFFVHVSGLVSTNLREGDNVTFETQQGKKGINAINVTLV